MIDSWNAAKLNERINQVEKKIQANDVIANPTGAATTDLSKISIDGTVYGTSVVKANPEGLATTSLSKVSIDGIVYDLVDSSIGTLKVTKTWTPGTAPVSINETILFSELDITNSQIIDISIISGSGNAVGFVAYITGTTIGLVFRQFAGIGAESVDATVYITYRK